MTQDKKLNELKADLECVILSQGAAGASDTGSGELQSSDYHSHHESDDDWASHFDAKERALHRALVKGTLQGEELQTWLAQQMAEDANYNRNFDTPKKKKTTTMLGDTKRENNFGTKTGKLQNKGAKAKAKKKATKTTVIDLVSDESYEGHTDSDYGDRGSATSSGASDNGESQQAASCREFEFSATQFSTKKQEMTTTLGDKQKEKNFGIVHRKRFQ